MSHLQFKTKLLQNRDWIILRLPMNMSESLPSRGMVMIEGTLNNIEFQAPLEPDGMGSHWFRISEALVEAAGIKVGDTVSLSFAPLRQWSEPELPKDLNHSLKSLNVENQWHAITTKARWEWIRWIRSTPNPQTRQKRIDTSCSMLASGKKRPCCFDHSRCTEPYVSKGGILDDPTH